MGLVIGCQFMPPPPGFRRGSDRKYTATTSATATLCRSRVQRTRCTLLPGIPGDASISPNAVSFEPAPRFLLSLDLAWL